MENKKIKIITFIVIISLIIPFYSVFSHTAENAGIIIEAGIAAMDEEIHIEEFEITREELNEIMRKILYSKPEFFYLKLGYKYSYNSKTGKIITVSPEYSMTKAEAEQATEAYNSYILEISSGAEELSDAEKVVYVYDRIAMRYEYDYNYEVYDAYNFFVKGRGVCQAYMHAFSAVLSHLGVENSWAYSEDMNHIWNLVRLEDEWYHADLTWDDSEDDIYFYHNYLLLSDKEMMKRKHYNWYSMYKCESAKYDNGYLKDVKTAFAFAGGRGYFVNSNGEIMLASDDMSTADKVMEFNEEWSVWGEESKYYMEKYAGIAGINGNLYISGQENVYRISEENVLETVYSYNGDDGLIFGLSEIDGELELLIGRTPSEVEIHFRLLSGDVDDNGILNSEDIIKIMKFQAGWNVGINSCLSDVNGDGYINVNDIILLMKYLAGWNVSLI